MTDTAYGVSGIFLCEKSGRLLGGAAGLDCGLPVRYSISALRSSSRLVWIGFEESALLNDILEKTVVTDQKPKRGRSESNELSTVCKQAIVRHIDATIPIVFTLLLTFHASAGLQLLSALMIRVGAACRRSNLYQRARPIFGRSVSTDGRGSYDPAKVRNIAVVAHIGTPASLTEQAFRQKY